MLKRHISIGVFVVYIDTGSSVLYIPSKSRDLADENNKILLEWKWFETTVLTTITYAWGRSTLISIIITILSRDDLFQLFNWFQLFFSENCFPKVAGHGQNRCKMTILKWVVDGVSFFHWFHLFYFLTRQIRRNY